MTDALEDSLLQEPALAGLLGAAPASLVLLAGGRNSRVYKVTDAKGGAFALKAYFRHPGDSRDRLGTEMGALSFLREQGFTCVPRPLASDSAAGLGLYEFIEGIKPCDIEASELDEAAEFLCRLHELCRCPEARHLNNASEARFSFANVADNVEARLHVLVKEAPILSTFLEKELIPAWRELLDRSQQGCAEHDIPFDQELELPQRTLSPSDFGFHNALRRDGKLVFLDFEYFGWDDPAKMIADVLLHPGMELSHALRLRLAEGVLAGFQEQPVLRDRVRLAYPLFGIKWCLILLNEFLPGHLDRRRFATPDAGTSEQRQALQLAKTRQKLQWIRETHDPFIH